MLASHSEYLKNLTTEELDLLIEQAERKLDQLCEEPSVQVWIVFEGAGCTKAVFSIDDRESVKNYAKTLLEKLGTLNYQLSIYNQYLPKSEAEKLVAKTQKALQG